MRCADYEVGARTPAGGGPMLVANVEALPSDVLLNGGWTGPSVEVNGDEGRDELLQTILAGALRKG